MRDAALRQSIINLFCISQKIDRENRKYRDQEKKQFNERIRNLVLFVKKRDPRWKERVVSTARLTITGTFRLTSYIYSPFTLK